MSEIQVHFNQLLHSVAVPNATVTHKQLAKTDEINELALATLQRISAQLSQLSCQVNQRFDHLQDCVLQTSVQVAKSVLQSDDHLIQTRTKQFVETCFDIDEPNRTVRIAVHPDCQQTIEKHLVSSGLGEIPVVADAQLQPGDCRIDAGQSGLIASLDACLDSVFRQLGSFREGAA